MKLSNDIFDESILVFEYYTASGIEDPGIISEAKALIIGLLNDLKGLNVSLLISPKFKDILNVFDDVNIIFSDEKLKNWLSSNINNFDSCMFISAEENMNLYNLTKLIEENNVKIYGSSSDASLIASNKYKTFKKLENIVKQPKTFKIVINENIDNFNSCNDIVNIDNFNSCNDIVNIDNFNSCNDLEIFIKSIFNGFDIGNNFKLIAKPINGVDCQDIVLLSSLNDVKNLKNTFDNGSNVLIQEFIEGDVVSVSLIANDKIAIPISLNKQYIHLDEDDCEYVGGMLPYDHELKNLAFEVSKMAVESIKGLKGFIGVDLILTDSCAYFLEINSRFTTPYVGLQKIANFNIGKTIIKLLNNELSMLYFDNINFENKVEFTKKGNELLIRNI
ncbi:ATP-grasp domain-containing protein [Methanobrevibacter filiformis]|uniref:Carbamoyl phosphate synthase-like protein n=1 Tax=Methanobrevibacter filiformis TaxID=55758 RepID=A0A162FL85_9EURY|nr:ATP-grasp domain-containing protein [Methanobrevibacter filiformis]KZX11700.1 carbamoyl phosphate synthase-like protein [Methanobrevibacter filiformis]